MPHTNRRKKASERGPPKVTHIKRTQIEDDDGWTHVIDAKKVQKPVNIKEVTAKKPLDGDLVSGNTAIVTMSYEEVEAENKRFRQQWEDSEACAKLRDAMANIRAKQTITNVACLGLGSLQDWKLQSRRTSHTQLSALRTIIEALGIESVRRIAQEPHFTDLDRRFMKSQDFEVLEDPEAFAQITAESLVFAVHCYPALYQQVGCRPQCAIFIGNDLGEYIQNTMRRQSEDKEQIADLEALIKDCEVLDFPQIRYDFTDTKIFYRPSPAPTTAT